MKYKNERVIWWDDKRPTGRERLNQWMPLTRRLEDIENALASVKTIDAAALDQINAVIMHIEENFRSDLVALESFALTKGYRREMR